MDYVYIVKEGPNEELRYSIRSVVKNMPNGNVWLVGGKPEWYTGNHIHIPQDKPKYNNAVNNLLAACRSEEISDDFVLMNDDFFAIKPIETIETFVGGALLERVALYSQISPTSTYTKRLTRTLDRLQRAGIALPLDYELHVPMPMNKAKLEKVLMMYPDSLWRSVYGNKYRVQAIQAADVKVYSSRQMEIRSYNYKSNMYPYVSSDDGSFETLLNDLLGDMFQEKSEYEAD